MLIPKIFHRIWLGPNPMPQEFVEYGESFKRLHPDWKFELWTSLRLPSLINRSLFDRGWHWSEKSDIVRYEVLDQFGGFYVDTDVECVKSFNDLLQWEFICGQQPPDYISTAIMGCEPHNLITSTIIKEFPASFKERPNDYMRRSVDILQRTISLHRHKLNLQVEPPSTFFPYNWNEMHRKGERFPDAHAIHHWAGSWGK